MNPLPSFIRACARRTTTFPVPLTTSSNLSTLTRPQARLLSTTTSTPSPSPPLTSSPPTIPLSTLSPSLQTGTITRVGTMTHCVQITQNTQIYDPFLQKHYTRPSRLLIHDPNPSGYLVEGDVIEFGLFSPSERAARLERKRVWDERLASEGPRKGKKREERTKWRGPKMVVRRVVTAFGRGVDERMELIARTTEEEKVVVPASKGGRVGKQHSSAKVAG